ncbi:MAG: hypothetical protein K2N06_08185 [Oscillospiraceae bacterium]|nr:hypothetical protein [Oscillospiraceae bacterium]
MTFEELDEILAVMPYAPFMVSLSEGRDNELTVKIAPSLVGESRNVTEEEVPNPQLRKILNDSHPIMLDTERVYEITFDRYIIYQVGNESFCSGNPNDEFSGGFLRVYTRSFLLDNLIRMTDAQICDDGSYYPAKWTHYQIITLNHIVDIISLGEPSVNFGIPS